MYSVSWLQGMVTRPGAGQKPWSAGKKQTRKTREVARKGMFSAGKHLGRTLAAVNRTIVRFFREHKHQQTCARAATEAWIPGGGRSSRRKHTRRAE
jgi:hypothetical protein